MCRRRARRCGRHGVLPHWRHIKGLRAVVAGDACSSVTPFPREKTPQDLAQEAHDGEFDHLTHESSLSPLERDGPRDAGWFPPAATVLTSQEARYEPPPLPTSRRKHKGGNHRRRLIKRRTLGCAAATRRPTVSRFQMGFVVLPRKPSDDYFVLDPGTKAPFELPAPPLTKEQPRCPIWSFGDTPLVLESFR